MCDSACVYPCGCFRLWGRWQCLRWLRRTTPTWIWSKHLSWGRLPSCPEHSGITVNHPFENAKKWWAVILTELLCLQVCCFLPVLRDQLQDLRFWRQHVPYTVLLWFNWSSRQNPHLLHPELDRSAEWPGLVSNHHRSSDWNKHSHTFRWPCFSELFIKHIEDDLWWVCMLDKHFEVVDLIRITLHV